MPRKLAQALSVVFHPLLMPTYSVLLLFQLNTYISHTLPLKLQNIIIGLVFLNTFVLPLTFVLILRKRKFISSLQMENKRERYVPFVLAFFFFGFTYYLLKQVNLPQPLYSLIIGASLAILLSLLANVFRKISIHLVGISGVVGGFYALALLMGLEIAPMLILITLVGGLIGSARLQMQSHSLMELFWGFLIGFGAEYFAVIFRIG